MMQIRAKSPAISAIAWLLLGMATIAALASFSFVLIAVKLWNAAMLDRLTVAFGVSVIYLLIAALLFDLRKVVTSVGTDPFTRTNARRLMRMAWVATAWQACELALAFSGQSVNLVSIPGLRLRTVEPQTVSIGGLLLVLILFALAKVFRTGAEIREELEGTV